jgi:hypothetical protein
MTTASASRPARSNAVGTRAPIQIGGLGCWIGFGDA